MDDDLLVDKLKKIKDFIVIVWILADIILLTLTYFDDLSSIYGFIVIFDTGLCAVLFMEFVYKLHTKENKMQYLRDDWRGVIVDVLAMFPYELISFGSYGFIRLLRLVRIFALLGKGRSTIFNFVEKTHLNYVLFTLMIIVVASSIAILVLETSPASEIHTPLDAIWYVVSTITTVGYGDEVPMSSGGKVLGIMLMIVGVGFFSILTASLSSYFMRDIETEEEELKDKINSLEISVNEMKSQIEEVKELLKENKR
jgi:voltage-gated potassium channel